jgi:hypothetical protein
LHRAARTTSGLTLAATFSEVSPRATCRQSVVLVKLVQPPLEQGAHCELFWRGNLLRDEMPCRVGSAPPE